MLARRVITLNSGAAALAEPYLPRAVLHDAGLAAGRVKAAEAEVERLHHQARQEREALLAAAQVQCWEITQAARVHWEAERQAMWEQIEAAALEVVNQALGELLGTVDGSARTRAVLHQVIARVGQPAAARLYAHPDELAGLGACLDQRAETAWTLHPDEAMARHQVRVVTDAGAFELAWSRAVQALLVPRGPRGAG